MSIFRRSTDDAETPAKGKRASRQQANEHEATVQRLRQQARRRLLGAAVLIGAGIVAFPLIFETQPRPVPMDLPIVIPNKDGTVARTAPSATLPASLPEDVEVQAAASEPPVAADPAPPPMVSETTVQAAAASTAGARLLPPASAPVSANPTEAGRYVVQVGAFADKDGAQMARRKLEAKGLKTYTHVVKTKDGERIRVRLGPFVERADAESAAAKAKAAGLAGTVLTL